MFRGCGRNWAARHAANEHARRTSRGSHKLQCVDQDGPLGIRRPRLVEAAEAPDHLRDRPPQRNLPDTAAWSFVYASILAKTGRSSAEGYGRRFAANVVEPPTIPRAAAEEMERLMAAARPLGSPEAEGGRRRVRPAGRPPAESRRRTPVRRRPPLASGAVPAWCNADGTTSHDCFWPICACNCMKRFSPQVMSVDFGEIDCAHYGSWSRYVEAIRRTDELTWRLWQTAQSLPDIAARR